MQSPLPDATTLEAGIIEDERPSRLSRVHDNVRNLLRTSMLGSVHSSPRLTSPVASPRFILTHPALWRERPSEVLPSPSTESVASTDSSSSASSTASKQSQRSTDMLLPPRGFNRACREVAHRSAMFNTRAIAALNQPNLSDPSLASIIHADAQERQRHAWKRSKRRHTHAQSNAPQWLLCVVIGLALGALLATYIALATTSASQPPVFHILFVLGILLVAIAFIHTVARLCVVPPKHSRRHKARSHHRRHHHSERRHSPTRREEHYSPPHPIQVLGPEDVTLDPEEAQPTSAVHQPPEVWNRSVSSELPNPPPAYGRWRGSVRADPELLHWQAVTSPTDSDDSIPSPIYEETPGAATNTESPPSYKTRESPARTRAGTNNVSEHIPKPEMVEGRGIGAMQSIHEETRP